MANPFPAKTQDLAPPPLRTEERHWTCADEALNGGVNQCDSVLKSLFVGVRTDPKDPKKFVPICIACAKLMEVKPVPPTHYGWMFALGFLAFPAAWWGLPMVWRVVFP